jgi:hypothetical protein
MCCVQLCLKPLPGKKKSLRIAFFTILHEFLFDLLVSPLKSLITKKQKGGKNSVLLLSEPIYDILLQKTTTFRILLSEQNQNRAG